MRSSAEGVDCANVSVHDQDPIGGLADAPTPLPTAWTMIWRRWRGFREWHREPLRASLWRQKVDVVKGREPKDFGHVGQSVQRLEQILELSDGGDPEERPGRLVGLVEIAVRIPRGMRTRSPALATLHTPSSFSDSSPSCTRINSSWVG